jgi:hypothetical protein
LAHEIAVGVEVVGGVDDGIPSGDVDAFGFEEAVGGFEHGLTVDGNTGGDPAGDSPLHPEGSGEGQRGEEESGDPDALPVGGELLVPEQAIGEAGEHNG